MKRRWGIAFGGLSALSFALGFWLFFVWLESFQRDFRHFSVVPGEERFTLKSHWGQFVLHGPPTDADDDADFIDQCARMSNEDFDWVPFQPGLLEGRVRENTPTWHVFQKFRQWQRDKKPQGAAIRLWQNGLEDRHRLLPAHMMLLFAGEQQRNQYFKRGMIFREAVAVSRPIINHDPESLEPPSMRDEPILYCATDASGNQPDLSQHHRLRHEWHDALDVARLQLFHGWLILGSMVLPLAWLTRPRGEVRTVRRWAYNWIALVSLIICIGGITLWIRSYYAHDQWTFVPRAAESIDEFGVKLRTQSWIGSANGNFFFRREITQVNARSWRLAMRAGHQGRTDPTYQPPGNLAKTVKGQSQLQLPGFGVRNIPVQSMTIMTLPYTPRGANFVVPASKDNLYVGSRSIDMSWWLLVALTSVLPILWFTRVLIRWRRMRKANLLQSKICLVCGYDLRASPGRCPECGSTSNTSQMAVAMPK